VNKKSPFDKPESADAREQSAISSEGEPDLTQVPAPQIVMEGVPDDNAGMAYAEEVVTADESRTMEGEVRERVDPKVPRDRLYVPDRIKAAWGVRSDEELIAIRSDERWGEADYGRFWRLQDKYGNSARILKGEDGTPRRHHDLVFAVIKKAARREADWDRINEGRRQYVKGLVAPQGTSTFSSAQGGFSENAPNTLDDLNRMYEEAHDAFRPMKQRWPGQMSLQEIEQYLGVEKIKQDEFEASRNGRPITPRERSAYDRFMASLGQQRKTIVDMGRRQTAARS